jgi:predicted dehydrogenase
MAESLHGDGYGDDELRKRAPRVKPIRLGLIGCGGIVQMVHAPSLLALPETVQVVAVADPVPENRNRVGEMFGVPESQRYVDHRTLLERATIDLVSIATPHHLHAEHVIAAAQAGVAVVCEKPMATSMAEADAILQAVRRSGVPYSEVHNLLFTLPMQEALAQIRSGVIGRPFLARGQSMFNKATQGDLPLNLWRNRKETGGGCLSDTAYHEIYSVEALVGSPIRYVEGRVRTVMFQVDVDDVALLLCEHENGALSTVSSSWCNTATESGRWCEVHGTLGAIRVNHRDSSSFLHYSTAENRWQTIHASGTYGADLQATAIHGHEGYFRAVCEALGNGTAMAVTVHDARHLVAVVEGARLATEHRCAVDVQELEEER